jgi:hypothetical protein
MPRLGGRVFITTTTREHDCGCVRRQEVGWVEPLVYHRMAVPSTVCVVSCVRFEVHEAVTVKDVGSCNLVGIYRRLGGSYRFHLQGRGVSLVSNKNPVVVRSAETSTSFYQTIRCYISEDAPYYLAVCRYKQAVTLVKCIWPLSDSSLSLNTD